MREVQNGIQLVNNTFHRFEQIQLNSKRNESKPKDNRKDFSFKPKHKEWFWDTLYLPNILEAKVDEAHNTIQHDDLNEHNDQRTFFLSSEI